jgi:O-antigen/teichoic acid export membrane protein
LNVRIAHAINRFNDVPRNFKRALPLTRPGGVCITCAVKLWRSGIFWSVLSFVGGFGNFAFAAMVARRLSPAEFGHANTTLGFISFLGLPLAMISTSLIHYIAHFRGRDDEARLQGLLAGCQKFLLQATIAGSLLAVVLADPLGRFFHFRPSLMLVALITILVTLWSGFGMALCQGMGWFKRLAIISLVGVVLRILFGWVTTKNYPTAEMAVLATTFSLLANLCLLYWWKDIFRHGSERISPWTRHFLNFLLVTGAYVAGNWFFLNGDSLVSNKYFLGDDLGAYQVAARWGLALPGTVAPLLLVMFASRSGGKEAHALSDQRILLGLYTVGLACGAAGLVLLREFLVKIICGHPNPEAAAMLIPYTITMAFVGLNQAIGLWSLASRWFKLTSLHGALGLIYWLALMLLGHTPAQLLHIMPLGAGAAFCILLVCWLWTAQHHSPDKAAN